MNVLQNLFEKINSLFSDGTGATAEETAKAHVARSGLKVSELRAEAKSRGLKGYSSLRKADLIKLLGG